MNITISNSSMNPKYFELTVQMCTCSNTGDGRGEMGWHGAGDGAEIFFKCHYGTAFVFFTDMNYGIMWGSKSVFVAK